MLPFKMIQITALLFLQFSGIFAEFPDCADGPSELTSNLVCDTTASPSDRAAAIVGAMELDEKLSILNNTASAIDRLGLPAYQWWNEALHGVGDSPGVIFEDSAFDDNLISDIATIISTEARAYANNDHAGLDFWTPNINPYKDPRWGRGAETPGEDTTRIQGYVNAFVQAFEGDDEDFKRAITTCKHFAGYDLETWNGNSRSSFDALISDQDMAEYYTPGFKTCARDANVGSFMCSYNSVNGIPSCVNSFLMETLLRDHWGWTSDNQYIVTDCNAVRFDYEYHDSGDSLEEATALSFNNGVDLVCEAGGDPVAAHDQGLLSEATVTKSLERQFEGLVRAGYFDTESTDPYRNLSWSDVNTAEAQDLALSSAQKGMVLLKNTGALPMDLDSGASMAMVGFWTNESGYMLGDYSGEPPFIHGPRYAARALDLDIHFATAPKNQSADSDDDTWTANAIAAADASDVIFYFGGIDNTIEKESRDRYSIAWPGAQQQLIETICDGSKPCIVVQMGSMLDATPLLDNDNVDAILWVGYCGQSCGTAIFDLITGKVCPSGRLPVTMYPEDYVDAVPMTDMSLRPSDSNPGRTYRWYDDAVLPFGYGLSYSEFSAKFYETDIGSISINSLTDGCDEQYQDLCQMQVSFSYTVENTGDATASFSALAFLSGEYGPSPYPIKTLVYYERFDNLAAGDTQEAEFSLSLSNLARYDDNGDQIIYPGEYKLLLDVPTQSTLTFELMGDELLLDQWPSSSSTLAARS